MRLQPEKFNRLLNGDVGQDFMWRCRYACPCVNPNSGAAKPACPLCYGIGHQWDAEVAGRAGKTNQTNKAGFANFGTWESGDAVLTIPSNAPFYGARQFDRFRSLEATVGFSENFIRGVRDRIFGTVKSISRVFWLTPDGTQNVVGDLPTVGPDGTLSWAEGANAPPAGVTYSASGEKYLEWYAYLDLPIDRNSGVSGLPRKLPVRLIDLLLRGT